MELAQRAIFSVCLRRRVKLCVLAARVLSMQHWQLIKKEAKLPRKPLCELHTLIRHLFSFQQYPFQQRLEKKTPCTTVRFPLTTLEKRKFNKIYLEVNRGKCATFNLLSPNYWWNSLSKRNCAIMTFNNICANSEYTFQKSFSSFSMT